jgi:hypothetical protein
MMLCTLFAWLISHQPTVFFSQNKPATSNQPIVLFSQNKPAPAISHQPNEQAVEIHVFCLLKKSCVLDRTTSKEGVAQSNKKYCNLCFHE